MARPLSPHLQIYKPQLTTGLSILHRLTGMGLSMGSLLAIAWLGALYLGQEAYDILIACLVHPTGKALLIGLSFCFYFHFANGIRHLFWDMGWGYELKRVYQSGWTVVGVAIGLTLLTIWRLW